jgi:alkylation response protein AidB-like acyl-CoA dehydrogenase
MQLNQRFSLAEREDFRTTVRSFLMRHCPDPMIQEWDTEEKFPLDLLSRMAEMGWLGMCLPEEFGGLGAGAVEMAVLGEELGRPSFDLAAGYGLTVFTALNIAHHGSQDLKQRVLPEVVTGRLRLAVAITEPNSGSDAASMSLKADRVGSELVLTGEKNYCTGADLPGTLIAIACRTNRTSRKQDGITLVMVPNDATGLHIRRLRTLGRRLLATAELHCDGLRASIDDVVGRVDAGWAVVTAGLALERLFVSAAQIGSAGRLLELATQHAQDRVQFGHRIGDFQAIAHMLADTAARIAAARALTYHVAELEDAGLARASDMAMAKLQASEAWKAAGDVAMQVAGGAGYVGYSHIQRHFRDSRAGTITAGTSQIQRNLIARDLGLRP